MPAAMNPGPRGDQGPSGFPTALGLGFYAALGAVGWVWRFWVDGVGPWEAPAAHPWPLASSIALGTGLGLLLVWGSRHWTAKSSAGQQLRDAMAEAVAGLRGWEVILLALTSGVAEEIFFRGALQPRVGWLLASLVFGAAHFVPQPGLRVWSVFAGLAGLLFAGLFEWTGSLAAPIAAHVTVNGLNLQWLARSGRRPGQSPPD